MPVVNPVASIVQDYLDRGGDPFRMMKAAILVTRRRPNDVGALMVLAEAVHAPEERAEHYRHAVDSGRRRWRSEGATRSVAFWDEPATRLFMHALHGCAQASGKVGDREVALSCIRELLEIDPLDRVGAQELALELGLTSQVDVDAGMAMKM